MGLSEIKINNQSAVVVDEDVIQNSENLVKNKAVYNKIEGGYYR